MSLPLSPLDFPLTVIGSQIYRRTESSPLFTAPNEGLAQDLAFRLNREEALKNPPSRITLETHNFTTI